ncbi:hypothetical protein AB7M49_003233 [Bradyrhizobium elkanii]
MHIRGQSDRLPSSIRTSRGDVLYGLPNAPKIVWIRSSPNFEFVLVDVMMRAPA